MPYKSPEARERHARKFFEAAQFAKQQINNLKAMGVTHKAKEWRQIRNALLKSYINQATADMLWVDKTIVNPEL